MCLAEKDHSPRKQASLGSCSLLHNGTNVVASKFIGVVVSAQCGSCMKTVVVLLSAEPPRCAKRVRCWLW